MCFSTKYLITGQLPATVGHLNKLETLHLHYNMLTTLPDTMTTLTSLRKVDLSHNHMNTFPQGLYSLPHLDYLNISHNKLRSLPEERIELLNTIELNLSANSLPCLPAGLSMCKRLKVLRAEENCLEISGVPAQLLENSKVSLLCLDGNLFQQKDLQALPGYHQVTCVLCNYYMHVLYCIVL